MKNEILIASNNPDKLAELSNLLSNLPVCLHNLSEYPGLAPTIEDQDNIAGNAMKKALEAASYSGMLAIADDTGLFIEALNGEPGVFAARFAGEDCSYADNRKKVLELMKGCNNRNASFRTAMALASPEGIIAVVQGSVEGLITTSERGEAGFGYDSIFEMNDKTYSEMDNETKNQCSHRAEAAKAMILIIEKLIIV
ncbi:MAG: RdgB/HAM1 family non-canonical purine NTP pyrophosphatase [Candidatus Cloacimonetes bacterium]|nr:RdgB/HAM1 family non-canonical purine NTP pyrophosphatase [Candidatus Cloacimonadota bacterium]